MPTPAELDVLRAEARYADERLRLHRQRLYSGRRRPDPRRLAELERAAEGAAKRLREARARAEAP